MVSLMEHFGDDDDTSTPDPQVATEQPAVGLIIRRVNDNQDLDEFKTARDAYVAALEDQPGVTTDREFESLVDFAAGAAPANPVFIGITKATSATTFGAAAAALNGTSEESTFFATFQPEFFGLLTPLAGGDFDLSALAPAGSGQVAEFAPRDLSQYANFDQAAYESARDAFLGLLSSRDGVITEVQWISPVAPDIAVGMTVYESFAAWQAIWSDPDFLNSAEYQAFMGVYPPAGGHLGNPVK